LNLRNVASSVLLFYSFAFSGCGDSTGGGILSLGPDDINWFPEFSPRSEFLGVGPNVEKSDSSNHKPNLQAVPKFKSITGPGSAFLAACEMSTDLETRKTVDAIKRKFESGLTCWTYADKLRRLREFYLGFDEIVDVSLLADLRGLTRLYLGKNRIVDISPLAGLT
jgi:Leucine-rich repeat (LRR) protein